MFSGLEDPLYTAEGIAILEDQVIVKSNKISGVKYALDIFGAGVRYPFDGASS
jgi:hypothetical protein